jgi:hypothetical protein
MLKRFLIVFAGVALSAASAETFQVKLFQSSVVQGTELKAGTYKMDLHDGQLVIKNGKQKLEVPVTVEKAGKNFGATMVHYTEDRGKYSIREIQLGGTKTRVKFGAATQSGGGQ